MKRGREESAVPESVLEAARRFWSGTEGRQSMLAMRMIGNSMGPLIKEGDRLHVDLRPTRFRPGDVLIWRQQEKLIAHRLVAIRKEELLLRGDANLAPDPPVEKNRIIGRVTGVENATGLADYSSLRWRTINPLMARFSGMCRILLRIKGRAARLILKIS